LNYVAEMQLIFLPCEKKERMVCSVVQLGNTDGTAERPAVVVFAVLGLAIGALDLWLALAVKRFIAVVEPVVRVEDSVLNDRVSRSVKSIRPGLDGEALNT